MKPVVSIICITYNHERFIRQALDGFFMQQTKFPFEIIVHDDASTDKTADIIRSYESNQQNPNVIFRPIYETKNQYSKGPYDFINDMLRSAKGDFLAFCEGDDFWTDAEKLQRQVDFLTEHPDYALSFHPVRVFYDDGSGQDYMYPKTHKAADFTLENLLKENFIQSNSAMYRARNYDHMPNDVMPHDWYLHLYHAQFGKIGFLNRTMAAYRKHAGGVWWGSQTDANALWKKQGLAHNRFYSTLLKLFGDNQTYRAILMRHVTHVLDKLVAVDQEYHTELLKEAIAQLPVDPNELVTAQYQAQQQTIQTITKHMNEQGKVIEHLTDQRDDLQRQYDNAMQELTRINAKLQTITQSRAWRIIKYLPIARRLK